jgi:hypothetical protein
MSAAAADMKPNGFHQMGKFKIRKNNFCEPNTNWEGSFALP